MSNPIRCASSWLRRGRLRSRLVLSAPVLLLLASCGSGETGARGRSCSVETDGDRQTLVCEDGTSAVLGNESGEGVGPCTVSDEGDGVYQISCPDSDPVDIAVGPGGDVLIESALEQGERCDGDGHVIRIGVDADGDGVLSDDEVTKTEVLCHVRVVDGNVILKSQTEVDDFRDVVRVTGNLAIQGDIEDLSPLDKLRFVRGHLYIQNTPLETLEGLSNLEAVKGWLLIKDNPALHDLTGLEGLESVDYLTIQSNESLETLEGLSQLQTVTSSIQIVANPALLSLAGLEGLTTIGAGLTINGNASLESLAGLSNVTSVGGDLFITQNPKVPTCAAEWLQNNIDTIEGDVTIENTDDDGGCD